MKNNEAVLKKYLNDGDDIAFHWSTSKTQEIILRLCNELAAKDADLKKLFKYDSPYCNAILKGEIPDQEAANNDG